MIEHPLTRDNVEQFLDEGTLYIALANGAWWCLRRNGKTRTYKRTGNWYIPVKYGFRYTTRINEADLDPQYLRHVHDVPGKKESK